MKKIIKNIKGTKDILSDDSVIWKYVDDYLHNYFRKFGYNEILTPTFENTELFQRSIGDITDIVSKEMYSWKDQGGNTLTLRPELTAPVVRSFIQHQLGKHQSINKLYYIGSMFRRERPQKGRFREFKQFGVEVFGSGFPEQDADIISMAYNIYSQLGISDLKLKINSIGSKETRASYKKELLNYFKQYENKLSSISKDRLLKNPLRILDSKLDFEIELVQNAPKMIEFLSSEDLEHFNAVKNHLSNLNIEYFVDDYLVRGLDYYSKTVFEIHHNALGAQNSLCGGGRYDYLVEELGGSATPAFGFAAGFERLIMAMNYDIENIKKSPDVYIVSLGKEAVSFSLNISNKLRFDLDLIVVNDTLQRSMKSQMKDANRLDAKYVILIGENEINNQSIIIKDMKSGEQNEVPVDQILTYFNNINNAS